MMMMGKIKERERERERQGERKNIHCRQLRIF